MGDSPMASSEYLLRHYDARKEADNWQQMPRLAELNAALSSPASLPDRPLYTLIPAILRLALQALEPMI